MAVCKQCGRDMLVADGCDCEMLYEIWKKDVWYETDGGMNPEDYNLVHNYTKFFVVPIDKLDEFSESMADDYGDQDYGYRINYQKVLVCSDEEFGLIVEAFKEARMNGNNLLI
jgi:hypothetical protein